MMNKRRLCIMLSVVYMISMCFGTHVFATEEQSSNAFMVFTGDLETNITTKTISSPKSERGLYASSGVQLIRGTTYDGETLGDEHYFYRNMLSDREKKAYDIIKNGLLSGTETIYIASSIYSSLTISVDEIQIILPYVTYDNPEIFWCDLNFQIASYNDKVAYIQPNYNDLVTNINTYQEQIDAKLEHAFQVMSTFSTDIAKVKYAHDYLVHTIDYVLDSAYNQNIYSSIINQKSVCAGYSKGFQYMMQKMNIPCTYISGTASGGGHAWNLLVLDDEYYVMDVTWDDPILVNSSGETYYDSNNYRYTYFNVTDEFLEQNDHIRTKFSVNLPIATGTKYSYVNYYNNDAYGTDFDAVEVQETTTISVPSTTSENNTTVEQTEKNTTVEQTENNTTVEETATTENITTVKQTNTTEKDTTATQTKPTESNTTENNTTKEETPSTEFIISTEPDPTNNSNIQPDTDKQTEQSTDEDKGIKDDITKSADETKKITSKKPSSVKIRKIVVKKRKLTITWKKGRKGVIGYQIQYSLNKKFKNKKTKYIRNINKLTYTTKKLKKGKTYYVRVRTYIYSENRKIYSNWSKVKRKKIK